MDIRNLQPFIGDVSLGSVSLVHNGNLINAKELRDDLVNRGAIFSASSDSELFLHLLARGGAGSVVLRDGLSSAIGEVLRAVKGAYSLILLFNDRLFAVRDPHGLRPLCIGKLGEGIVLASETCAFDLIGASYLRDVEPGELVEISGTGEIKSFFPFVKQSARPCIFEYVYFARPDSKVFGENVYKIRKALGAELAKESPVAGDIVVPVPDSGIPASLGYAEFAGIPLELGLIRNHYVGRTFIEPKQTIRDFGVKIKLNANADILQGKRVIVVDDSIVRGTTSRKLVMMFRNAGASEVHLRISSPPTVSPCYYGIDTPDKSELIAAQMSSKEIEAFVGADSLAYLSLDGLYRAVGAVKSSFCDACFTGKYLI
jgi:amidophosphoribosyltransferase